MFYICNGEPGALVKITDEPAGANCEFGGQKIDAGPDTNQNGMLDDDEVDYTEYICNGASGGDGMDGDDGPQGPPGDDGEDGLDSITDLNVEPAGDNCPNGGIRIDTGLDLDRDGVLDPEEITETAYVCDGDDGTGSSSGCAIAGNSTTKGGLAGLLLYALIPAAIVLRRKVLKRKNKQG